MDNKARVVEHAATVLIRENQQESPAGEVESDWLNSFERFCEDASSEKMQQMWGRVLAGEVSRPGSFGKSTIRLISELDHDTARDFEDLASWILDDKIINLEEGNPSHFAKLLNAEAAGLITGVGGLISWNPHVDDNKIFSVSGQSFAIVGRLKENEKLSLPVTPLTRVGKEIFRILPKPDEEKILEKLSDSLFNREVDFINKAEIEGIAIAKVNRVIGNVNLQKIRVLWGSDPFEQSN